MASQAAPEKPGVLFSFPECADLGRRIARHAGWSYRAVDVHHFPDGESLVRLRGAPGARPAAVLRSLDNPNAKLLETVMALDTARREGATKRILLAPYMPYMRQDAAFRPGEAISQVVVGKLLSRHMDRVLTVNVHLHRSPNLWAVFRRPGTNLDAAPLFASRVRKLHDPLVIGPDEESGGWARALASAAGAEGAVAAKSRDADGLVRIQLPDGLRVKDRDVVVFDDILSTGVTGVKTAQALKRRRPRSLRLFAVHPLLAGDAEARLRAAGYVEIVTTDAVDHPTNGVALSSLLGQALTHPQVLRG